MKILSRISPGKYLLLFLFVALTKSVHADPYDDVRLRWANMLTGGDYQVDEPYLKLKVNDITNAAQRYWKTDFNTASNRTVLWKDLDYSKSSDITNSYARLNVMAVAYATKSSALYKNEMLLTDIIQALEWLNINKYNTTVPLPNGSKPRHVDNWWDYKIGTPLSLNKVLVLLYNELGDSRRAKYLAAVAHFTPNLTDNGFTNGTVMEFTAANRIWICTILTVKAILLKDEAQLQYARKEMNPVFSYVRSGDGFYTDGSFIQHDGTPYTGGYGLSLIDNLAILMYILAKSPWELNNPGLHNIYDWIHNSFEPIVSGSGIMGMVTGREISRNRPITDIGFKRLLDPVLLLSEIAKPEDAKKLQNLLKKWLTRYTALDYKTFLGIYNYGLAKKIAGNASIKVKTEEFYKEFPNMDRVVVHRQGYTFGVSMHSDRTYNYESINNENLKGWHTGDGMTYLYNGDITQFEGTFWPTVNYYRLPGTTVEENTTLTPVQTSRSNWVGGTSIKNRYGVTGMSLAPKGQSLEGKKSWFIFDDEIVALGAGIFNGDHKNVQTFVEQRKLGSTSDTFSVNGVKIIAGESELAMNVSWAHLSGNVPNTDIGYYFPDKPQVHILRNIQSGRWNEINTTVGSDTTLKTNPFLSLWFNHGIHQVDNNREENKYAYVLLPGANENKIKAYAASPDISILENSAKIQAVYEEKLGIVGVNFWTDERSSLSRNGRVYLTCNKKAAVMVQENAKQITVSLSDPTMQNNGSIELLVYIKSGTVISKDTRLQISKSGAALKIKANVAGLKGSKLTATIAK
ncbi:polysaccharide lyase 8 family protein [Pedobacter duraquae]|nr:polysaccharide lyase 8 family protein [Pedobacter duraquae]